MMRKNLFINFIAKVSFHSYREFFMVVCYHWDVPTAKLDRVFEGLFDIFHENMSVKFHLKYEEYYVKTSREAEIIYDMINEYMEEIFYD